MSWIKITEIENIPLREGRSVKIAGEDIAVFNLGNRFAAVENKCPHSGGPLCDGIVSGAAVVCPLHGWRISLDSGQVLNRPSEACVAVFDTKVENGVLLMNYGRVREAVA